MSGPFRVIISAQSREIVHVVFLSLVRAKNTESAVNGQQKVLATGPTARSSSIYNKTYLILKINLQNVLVYLVYIILKLLPGLLENETLDNPNPFQNKMNSLQEEGLTLAAKITLTKFEGPYTFIYCWLYCLYLVVALRIFFHLCFNS